MPGLPVALRSAAGWLRRLAWAGWRTAVTLASTALALIPTALAETGIQQLTNNITTAVQALGGLLIAIAAALFGVGLATRYLPWGSQRTKDFGGMLLDHGLMLAALGAIGVYLLFFAGDIAVAVTGYGEAPEPSGPWEVPQP